MPGFASHVLAEETSAEFMFGKADKMSKAVVEVWSQPLAEIRSLAAASSWYNGTPGRIFEIAVSLDALVVSYTSLCASLTVLK